MYFGGWETPTWKCLTCCVLPISPDQILAGISQTSVQLARYGVGQRGGWHPSYFGLRIQYEASDPGISYGDVIEASWWSSATLRPSRKESFLKVTPDTNVWFLGNWVWDVHLYLHSQFSIITPRNTAQESDPISHSMTLRVACCFNFKLFEDAVHPCAWFSLGFGGESWLKLLRFSWRRCI